MQITVDRAHLAAAITWAMQGISKRPGLPILAGLRVTADGGTLTLAGFDYGVTARAHVFGDGEAPGSALVTGSELAAIVKALPKVKGTRVTVTGDDTAGLTVTCGSLTMHAAAMPSDEYPELPAMPPLAGVVDGQAFGRMVARVSAAAGRDDTLPILTCVRIEPGDRLAMVATDRYRVALDSAEWAPAAEFPEASRAVSVPAAVLAAFAKATKGAGMITVSVSDDPRPENERGYGAPGAGLAGFATGERELIVQIAGGEFPRYRGLIPSDSETVVSADAATLAAAVKRAGAVSGRNERMDFTANGSIALAAHRDGQESGSEHVPANRTGPEVASGFNPGYLAELLAGVSGTVQLGFNGAAKPVLITACAEGDDYRALLMPIRLAA